MQGRLSLRCTDTNTSICTGHNFAFLNLLCLRDFPYDMEIESKSNRNRKEQLMNTIILLLLQFAVSTNLEGRIYAAGTHEAVPVARVRLERLGLTVQEARSIDGRFQFRGLLPARYTIVVDS